VAVTSPLSQIIGLLTQKIPQRESGAVLLLGPRTL